MPLLPIETLTEPQQEAFRGYIGIGAAIADHAAATDPHGDRAYTDDQIAAIPVAPLANYVATVPPTVDDDSGEGYSIGSPWYDTVGLEAYRCVSAAPGAAVWIESTFDGAEAAALLAAVIRVEGGGVVLKGTTDPTSPTANTGINSVIAGANNYSNSGAYCQISGYNNYGNSGTHCQISGYFNNNNSGNYCSISGYSNHTNSGSHCQISGAGHNYNTGTHCQISGSEAAYNTLSYARIHGGGSYARIIDLVAKAFTTDATPTTLTLGGAAEDSTNRINIPLDTAWLFTANIVARDSTSGTKFQSWTRQGLIYNAAGTTTLDGLTGIGADRDVGTLGVTIAITADDTNDALRIEGIGVAETNIHWTAQINITQVG